eukprot:TCONS_00004680-protein
MMTVKTTMAGISLSNLQGALNEIGLTEKELYIGGLLAELLVHHEILSVSFINSQLNGKKKGFSITFDFLRKTKFELAVIGCDLKIMRMNPNYVEDERFVGFSKSDDFYNQLFQIIQKDNQAYVQLKRKLINEDNNNTARLDDVFTWSSNKFKFNVPFLLRNSHKFEIFMDEDVSYVRLAEVHQMAMRIEFGQDQINEIIQSDKRKLVVECLKRLLAKLDHPVNQGTFQACIDYGFPPIDKLFMQCNGHLFVFGGADRKIALKGSKAAREILKSSHASPPQGYKSEPKKYSTFTTAPHTTTPAPKQNLASTSPIPNNTIPQLPTTAIQQLSSTGKSILSASLLSDVEKAYQKGQTVVVVGKDSTLPVVFLTENTSNVTNLEMLVGLKSQLESEIHRRTFAK